MKDVKTYSGKRFVLFLGIGIVLFFALMLFGTIALGRWMQPRVRGKVERPGTVPQAAEGTRK